MKALLAPRQAFYSIANEVENDPIHCDDCNEMATDEFEVNEYDDNAATLCDECADSRAVLSGRA